MNNKTLMWALLAVGAYFLLTKQSPAGTQPQTPAQAGLQFDPLTGGWCYPPGYTGSMIGPYPSC